MATRAKKVNTAIQDKMASEVEESLNKMFRFKEHRVRYNNVEDSFEIYTKICTQEKTLIFNHVSKYILNGYNAEDIANKISTMVVEFGYELLFDKSLGEDK